ncbi:MAG: hypothetical protein L0219_18735 [Phycisphaerales bacterium]|nr:hypothetical protein [Phycisphaerales bacterium]
MASGLGADGGYNSRWVRVESRPLPFFFPNSACRVAAAKLHDLHHIATEYDVDWIGEAEIAGWEIASGCGKHGWAWILNLGAFTVGLFRSPRRLFRAFIRGRRATTNLYKTGFPEPALQQTTFGDLRRRFGMHESPTTAHSRDILLFALWALAGVGWHFSIGASAIVCAWVAVRAII